MTEDNLGNSAPPPRGPSFQDWFLWGGPKPALPSITAEEFAAAMAADPKWRFDVNPIGAVGAVSTSAATAALAGRTHNARYWTAVGLALVRLADSPHIKAGAVLEGLAAKYNLA
jgi:hypothetical protein